MRELRWYLVATLLVLTVTAAEAQFPKPRSASPPVAQNNAPVAAPAAPVTQAEQPAPVVVTTAAPESMFSDIIKAIWAGIAAMFTGLAGYLAPAAKARLKGTASLPAVDPVPVVLADPNVRVAIDQALLRVVQSGIPGAGLTTAASLVPGAAPIVNMLEPMLRRVVTEALQARAETQRAGAPGVFGGGIAVGAQP